MTEEKLITRAAELIILNNNDILLKRRKQGNIEGSRKTKLSNVQHALQLRVLKLRRPQNAPRGNACIRQEEGNSSDGDPRDFTGEKH